MDKNVVSSSVRKFITTHFPPARNRALTDDDPLLESGIVDSMGVLDMITFIEAEFNIPVVDDELIPENFKTIREIVNFIEGKQKGTARVYQGG